MEITAWDVGGRSNLRPLWRHYYKSTEGIVFVIDTYDRERLEEASEQLQRLLAEDDLLGIPLLIFANKADLPSKVTLTELSKILKLDSIRRKYHVCSSVATTGVGLLEGMKWLTLAIRSG